VTIEGVAQARHEGGGGVETGHALREPVEGPHLRIEAAERGKIGLDCFVGLADRNRLLGCEQRREDVQGCVQARHVESVSGHPSG